MGRRTIMALRIVLALLLAGSFFVQAVMVPLLGVDLRELAGQFPHLRVVLLGYIVLLVMVVQTCTVCVWKLATRVRLGTVFTPAAFKFVDLIIAAIAVASLATFGLGAMLAPGEIVAPGVVLLIGGLGVLVLGIGLIVLVLRQLLVQATTTDVEAQRLRTELGGVI